MVDTFVSAEEPISLQVASKLHQPSKVGNGSGYLHPAAAGSVVIETETPA